jgi:hypothetical protein
MYMTYYLLLDAHHQEEKDRGCLYAGGSGTFAHLYVYSTQFYYQMNNYSGTSWSTFATYGGAIDGHQYIA